MTTSFRAPLALSVALALSISLAWSQALARACAAIDLRSQVGAIRNQGKTGWCHSFTAADVLGSKIGYQVSSVDIARSYYSDRSLFMRLAGAVTGSTDTAYPGSSAGALATALDQGVCSESVFPFEIVRQSLGTPLEEALRADCDRTRVGFKSAFRLRRQVVSYGDGAGATTLRKQLRRGNIVAIDYDVKPLLTPAARARAGWGEAGHSSTVVAMRSNPDLDECEFLIRGSWGSDCRYFDSKRACEDGNVWVTESDISYMMFSLTWLENRR